MTDPAVGTNYCWATEFIRGPIGSVVEVGSRDGMDALYLVGKYNCSVVAFECDPVQFPITEKNLQESMLVNVRALPFALLDKDGPLTFWQVDQEQYPSAGISSLLEINFENRQVDDVDGGRASIQFPVEVVGHRFDSLGLASPELLALDVQGMEVNVLRGFGELLQTVKYIVTEVERVPSYKGGNSFRTLNRYLHSQGFQLVASSAGGSSRFARMRQLISQNLRIVQSDRTWRPWTKYQGCFDAIYKNRKFEK